MASSILTQAPVSGPSPPSYHHNGGTAGHAKSPSATANSAVVLVAKFDYKANEPTELDLKKAERLLLIDSSKNWWLVRKLDSDQTG